MKQPMKPTKPEQAPTPERSRVMRAVRSTDTRPELIVRRLLHSLGYRYRLHRMDLPGTPDIVFPGRRKTIFVHGCFWHGHDCARGARQPVTNAMYWKSKITRNLARDKENMSALEQAGWRPFVVWECALRRQDRDSLTSRLVAFLEAP